MLQYLLYIFSYLFLRIHQNLHITYTVIHRDLAFILSLGGEVDWVALSFVQTPQDMVEFRQLAGDGVKLMAKLEKPSAIEYLDEVSSLMINMLWVRASSDSDEEIIGNWSALLIDYSSAL